MGEPPIGLLFHSLVQMNSFSGQLICSFIFLTGYPLNEEKVYLLGQVQYIIEQLFILNIPYKLFFMVLVLHTQLAASSLPYR